MATITSGISSFSVFLIYFFHSALPPVPIPRRDVSSRRFRPRLSLSLQKAYHLRVAAGSRAMGETTTSRRVGEE